MVAGAAGTFSILLSSFLAFSLPVLFPLTIRFFLSGDQIHIAMGGMTVLFMVLIMNVALRVHSMTMTTLELSAANSRLAALSAMQEQEAKRLNENLAHETVERKDAEQKLQDLRAYLEERLRLQTMELSEATARLEKEVQVRTKAEEALQRNHDYYRSVIEERRGKDIQ